MKTNSVYVLAPHEDWIIDRLTEEWYADNGDISTRHINTCDVVWLFGGWCYRSVDRELLKKKKVITTIHHIVPAKFTTGKVEEFYDRDVITDAYHVPNINTANFIKDYTKKRIEIIPYWANQNVWKKTGNKAELRAKYGIPRDAHVIGSFQRDTEGYDLRSPKLEKGPDLFVEYVKTIRNKIDRVFVVLSGWRREYVINRLRQENIEYTYIENPPLAVINDLYQTLDIYPVTSRYEGGPQSLIEAGLLQIPVISRDIGMARVVLSDDAIRNDVTLATPEVPSVSSLLLPGGYVKYREMIQSL